MKIIKLGNEGYYDKHKPESPVPKEEATQLDDELAKKHKERLKAMGYLNCRIETINNH